MYKVPLTTIVDIFPHPNAERLDVAIIYGFHVVIQKNKYKVGDRVVFIPPDSVITNEHLENHLFPPGSKVVLNNHKVRHIRIRGYQSYGMIIHPDTLKEIGIYTDHYALEDDLSGLLGVQKYEPPVPDFQTPKSKKERKQRSNHPQFHCYNGVNNIKWLPNLFQDGEEVIVQEKLHGSNWRGGWLKNTPDTLWKKILKFFGKLPEYEFFYGSNNVQISGNEDYKGFYGGDVYGAVAKKLNAHARIRKNEIVYGELIGPGIQKNYTYGHKEHHLVIFDVKVFDDDGNWKWLNPIQTACYAAARGFDFVPILYSGPYNKDHVESLVGGPSVYCKDEPIREGIVIKSVFEYNDNRCESNKKCVKWINPEYLNSDNSENH